MWIEPLTINLSPSTPVGFKFNVTVWLNMTTPANAWQFYLVYKKAYLNATRCSYTGNGKSLWSGSNPTDTVTPYFGQHNSTHDFVLLGEVLKSSAQRTGSGSLAWIEFKIVQVPSQALALQLRLDLIGIFDSFVWDKDFNIIGINFGKATVIFNPLLTATKIAIFVSPNPASVGSSVTLQASLMTVSNVSVAGAALVIKVNGGLVGTMTTNATGWIKAVGKPVSAGNYNITISYAGSAQYLPSSASKILIVNPLLTEIYAKLLPNTASPGATVTRKGILMDQLSTPTKTATITLQVSSNYGLNWVSYGTATTSSYGIFSKTFTAPAIDTYIYRMTYAGSTTYSTSTADTTLVIR
jgi:hypothetical protein